jgi:hypothetical protein
MVMSDGMVSLEDVEKAVFDRLCETSMKAGEISKIMDNIHDRLAKPKPDATLLDPTGGPSMDVPASVVHEMEYPEVGTYSHERIYANDACVCESCGAVVVDPGKHTAFHGRVVK